MRPANSLSGSRGFGSVEQIHSPLIEKVMEIQATPNTKERKEVLEKVVIDTGRSLACHSDIR